MILEMDEHLKSVVEFMQSTIPAEKIVGVANAISALAPSFWGQYGHDDIVAIWLLDDPICVQSYVDDQHTQSTAT